MIGFYQARMSYTLCMRTLSRKGWVGFRMKFIGLHLRVILAYTSKITVHGIKILVMVSKV